jgi:prophage regulatory protein
VNEELVGVAEVAQMLDVSRQRVDAIAKRHDDFPKPIAELMAGRIWVRQQIEEWQRERRGGTRAAG